MTRRRDPISPRELARLGETVLENPSAAPVFHDALLEQFGDRYASVVREAVRDADAFQECTAVRVDLEALGVHLQHRSGRGPSLPTPRGAARSRWEAAIKTPSVFPFRRLACSSTHWAPHSVVSFMVQPRVDRPPLSDPAHAHLADPAHAHLAMCVWRRALVLRRSALVV